MLDYMVESTDDIVLEEKAGSPRAARPLVRLSLAVLALAAVFLAVILVRGWRPGTDNNTTTTPAVASSRPVVPTSPEIEAMYGIRFTLVNVTAGGGMIQVHYQVIDSDKTESIHDETIAPYIIDSHGAKYADPGMVGHSHVGAVKAAGTTDFILLANAGGGVKAGSLVTIKVGDLELHDVPVE